MRLAAAAIVLALAACADEPPRGRADLAALDDRIALHADAAREAHAAGDEATARIHENAIDRLRKERDRWSSPAKPNAAPSPVKFENEARRHDQKAAELAAKGSSVEAAREMDLADRARAQADVERRRQAALDDIRRRTPNRLVNPGSAPARAAASKPASSPASSPARDEEIEALFDRLVRISDLRASAGDDAGAARLRRALGLLRAQAQDGDRDRALETLRGVLETADR
ncbi:MAG TPA: hypothetical protein VKE69_08125 [Planctomycetota bacterium]|nr:hypothetical protein [Planctomycetota bacterium]